MEKTASKVRASLYGNLALIAVVVVAFVATLVTAPLLAGLIAAAVVVGYLTRKR